MIEIPETQNTQIDEETELIKELGEIRNNVRLRSISESSKDNQKKVPSYFQGIIKKGKTDSSINEILTKQSLIGAYSDSD
ncbi:hypothetical protein A3Q56_06617 [Intoshia linei]|uniref:Uncharacterized protein n=1 Tax=Intoshia linei TaxID=1819745 RepID=A0A177AVW4_9BILA|nr:hypothetical protein A3Q56_06617 [Intoshia linei]